MNAVVSGAATVNSVVVGAVVFGAVALSVLDVRTAGAVYRKMLQVLFTCAVADVAGAVPADAAPPREETYNLLMN